MMSEVSSTFRLKDSIEPRRAVRSFRSELIPEEVDVCCLLALGYAAEPFKEYGGRFGIEQVFFGERYGQSFTL